MVLAVIELNKIPILQSGWRRQDHAVVFHQAGHDLHLISFETGNNNNPRRCLVSLDDKERDGRAVL